MQSCKDYEWELSPDGSRIAIHKIIEGPIQIISLAGLATNSMQRAEKVGLSKPTVRLHVFAARGTLTCAL
jgi:hypothetical protein